MLINKKRKASGETKKHPEFFTEGINKTSNRTSLMLDEGIEAVKQKLRSYKREEIIFNEPHFTNQLLLREGSKEEVIKNLLEPEKMAYYYIEKGKYGDEIYCLHFNISNTRTIKLPVIFNKNNERNLYVITYIMRYRPWQSMIRRGRR